MLTKLKTIYYATLTSKSMSINKFSEVFQPLVEKFGKLYDDLNEYGLEQIHNENGEPTDQLLYFSDSLDVSTYKIILFDDIEANNLDFVGSYDNRGIFRKTSKTKVLRYWGPNKMIVNHPNMVPIFRGDYIFITNDLLNVMPKNKFKELFKR
jgi:hypothetical protein